MSSRLVKQSANRLHGGAVRARVVVPKRAYNHTGLRWLDGNGWACATCRGTGLGSPARVACMTVGRPETNHSIAAAT